MLSRGVPVMIIRQHSDIEFTHINVDFSSGNFYHLKTHGVLHPEDIQLRGYLQNLTS